MGDDIRFAWRFSYGYSLGVLFAGRDAMNKEQETMTAVMFAVAVGSLIGWLEYGLNPILALMPLLATGLIYSIIRRWANGLQSNR